MSAARKLALAAFGALLAATLCACGAEGDPAEANDGTLSEEEIARIVSDRETANPATQQAQEEAAAQAAAEAEAKAKAKAEAEAKAAAEAEAAAKAAEAEEAAKKKAEEEAARSQTADELLSRLDISYKYVDELDHGEKGAPYQRYIVLHDTEGGGSPEGVVDGWVNAGRHIAAHFVIGKDGHIVQCVPIDRIGHHAGYGDTGHNDYYGISEDGRDDMLGASPIGDWASDYGMNAWSIGVEMIHIGGEGDYPEAQLEALDGLIAYLDAAFGGSAGTIIDHKMWRSGNSDTSAEFAGYLANYIDHRTHN